MRLPVDPPDDAGGLGTWRSSTSIVGGGRRLSKPRECRDAGGIAPAKWWLSAVAPRGNGPSDISVHQRTLVVKGKVLA